MILIADSGATKTDWLLINGSNYTLLKTRGINAYYMSSEEIRLLLENELKPLLPIDSIKSIFFYGSGCSTKSKCEKISEPLRFLCPGATIEVNHDLLAAARALFNRDPGIACILGTGSNSCYYDGKNITRQMVSLGYFFGDEGSGTHLGKLLIADYLKNEMPDTISDMLESEYNLSLEYVLDNIYNNQSPNKFLSSFAPFIQKNSADEYIKALVSNSFKQFFDVGIKKFSGYKTVKAGFVGSIAYHFTDILLEVADENNITIGKIEKSVIEGLKIYHIR